MFKLLNIHVVIVWGGTGEDNTRDKCGTPGISVVTHRGHGAGAASRGRGSGQFCSGSPLVICSHAVLPQCLQKQVYGDFDNKS